MNKNPNGDEARRSSHERCKAHVSATKTAAMISGCGLQTQRIALIAASRPSEKLSRYVPRQQSLQPIKQRARGRPHRDFRLSQPDPCAPPYWLGAYLYKTGPRILRCSAKLLKRAASRPSLRPPPSIVVTPSARRRQERPMFSCQPCGCAAFLGLGQSSRNRAMISLIHGQGEFEVGQ